MEMLELELGNPWTETWRLGQRRCTRTARRDVPFLFLTPGDLEAAAVLPRGWETTRAEERGWGARGKWPWLRLQGLPPDSGHNKFSQG